MACPFGGARRPGARPAPGVVTTRRYSRNADFARCSAADTPRTADSSRGVCASPLDGATSRGRRAGASGVRARIGSPLVRSRVGRRRCGGALGGRRGCAGGGRGVVDGRCPSPEPVRGSGISLFSVSTPPASCTVWNAPTAIRIARTTPIQLQIVDSSPGSVRILMIAKNRMRTPSSAAVIAVETGSGMSTDASRTTIQARSTIVRRPRTMPTKPRQPLNAGAADSSQRPEVELELLPGQEQADEEQHASPRASSAPRGRGR